MKTKPFLLATAGSTVDGRTIDDKMIAEMASSYDPKTYGARLNIEHIRGISGQPPFRAFGDVVELTTGEVDVNFNGKTEKRTALYGVFDVNEDAKQLNAQGQKVYPSIEIEPNFGGKGFAYLMGCALTDSPAAIATERLAFNRHLPGTLALSRDEATVLEFAEETTTPAADSFLSKLGTMMDGFSAKFGGAPAKVEPEPKADPVPGAFDFAEMRPLFQQLGESFAASVDGLRTEMRGEIDALGIKLKKLDDEREAAPDPAHLSRPAAAGANGKYAKTDC